MPRLLMVKPQSVADAGYVCYNKLEVSTMHEMTLAEIIQDIHAMDEELWHYEARYGLRSQYFYELYKAGKLPDEDPVETRDYTDWAACYEVKRHREELYDALVRDILQEAESQPAISLSSLKLALSSAPSTIGA